MWKQLREVPRRVPVASGSALVATAALATSMLLTPVPARADNAVLEWNQIALGGNRDGGSGPTSADTDDGHCPCVCSRRGECDYLRLPDVSLDRLWALGLT